MEIDFSKYNIYIKPGVTDMRKRAESLSFLVRTEMGMDPMEKSIFLFCGKNRHRIVAIVWERNGWLEISKRLDCTGGTFCWPKSAAEAEKVSIEDVLEMLKGGNPWRRFPAF